MSACLETLLEKAQQGDRDAREQLVVDNSGLVWSIARRFYGKGSLYARIAQANSGIVKNPNLIYPGQVLTIPPLSLLPGEGELTGSAAVAASVQSTYDPDTGTWRLGL